MFYLAIKGVGSVCKFDDRTKLAGHLSVVLKDKFPPEARQILFDWTDKATVGSCLCVVDRVILVTDKDVDVLFVKPHTILDAGVSTASYITPVMPPPRRTPMSVTAPTKPGPRPPNHGEEGEEEVEEAELCSFCQHDPCTCEDEEDDEDDEG